jgi:putative membrane protein insertion efficiency factor
MRAGFVCTPSLAPAATEEISSNSKAGAALLFLARFLVHLPASIFLLLIRIYQRTLSPVLPAFFGSACGCRFAPSCSHYAAEAIRTHGALAGVVLAAIRLVKCTPLHPGGFDPVPPRRSRPQCERFAG